MSLECHVSQAWNALECLLPTREWEPTRSLVILQQTCIYFAGSLCSKKQVGLGRKVIYLNYSFFLFFI